MKRFVVAMLALLAAAGSGRAGEKELTPAERGYKEDWLVPAQCRRRVPVGDWGPCRCEADTR